MHSISFPRSAKRPRKYYRKELKAQVVSHIVNGEYLLEEVMQRYQIDSRDAIIRWLSDHIKNVEKQRLEEQIEKS